MAEIMEIGSITVSPEEDNDRGPSVIRCRFTHEMSIPKH